MDCICIGQWYILEEAKASKGTGILKEAIRDVLWDPAGRGGTEIMDRSKKVVKSKPLKGQSCPRDWEIPGTRAGAYHLNGWEMVSGSGYSVYNFRSHDPLHLVATL